MCCMKEASNARRTRTCQRLCEVGSGYRLRLRWETTSTGLICMEFSVQVYLPRHPPACAERANGEGDVRWGHATAIWCRYVLTQPLRPSRGMGPLPVGAVLSLNVTLAACNGGRRADQHKIPGICPEQGNFNAGRHTRDASYPAERRRARALDFDLDQPLRLLCIFIGGSEVEAERFEHHRDIAATNSDRLSRWNKSFDAERRVQFGRQASLPPGITTHVDEQEGQSQARFPYVDGHPTNLQLAEKEVYQDLMRISQRPRV
ncbi:hypothetical protein GLOTRDRAFT_94022 [Gloeophyllum trabeum ATCC 11539]|uniref:Uncharacterized protein n=1 Tax=Gloeophyllum trabeum (strain ATCC 11539 / FP-39264 / Madison 617) TaxID=670483 RepID=S7Q4U5_GLOTA|nr:uncharacterized protein GLOTRDRAFT_94022 [Gloeophyllum trabeum ATCC 11539]EPQ54538.1 hypothetical protein GLOTRDRAFT_94022 [Gloeophyllum trabeum ATCC 11539]